MNRGMGKIWGRACLTPLLFLLVICKSFVLAMIVLLGLMCRLVSNAAQIGALIVRRFVLMLISYSVSIIVYIKMELPSFESIE